MLSPCILGEEHYHCARGVQKKLQNYKNLQDIIAILGSPGKYVDLKDSVAGFQGVLAGKYDNLPEQAFYMVGGIEEVAQKAEKMAQGYGLGHFN
ncbi:unnamed protein product [Sphagnum tenellum]